MLWKNNAEGGTFTRLGSKSQLTTVRFDDASCNRKAQSSPGLFRTKKGVKEPLLDLRKDASTGVLDVDKDASLLPAKKRVGH
jgi:hypothetical protein